MTVEYVLFATIMRMVEHQSGKFPVFSLVIREFDHGDWFASDCTIHHPVPRVSDISENRSKSGERDTGAGVRNFPLDLCFRDLATKALGGENAPNRGFGRFAARFIRRNQIRGHDENASDHGNSAIADGQADVAAGVLAATQQPSQTAGH